MKPLETTKKATDAVLRALELFGESEPEFAIVIFLDENNELHWLRSDVSSTMTVGCLEQIKCQVQHDWLNAE